VVITGFVAALERAEIWFGVKEVRGMADKGWSRAEHTKILQYLNRSISATDCLSRDFKA
jgi:hypothetical protein